MKIDRRKYELARARKCVSTRDIVASGVPRGSLTSMFTGGGRPETAGKLSKCRSLNRRKSLKKKTNPLPSV